MTPMKAEFVGSFDNLKSIPSDGLPQIAFGGRSNVGKSTLLNTLVGQRKLARTSKTPGRTQSLNFFLINNRYYFVDLPGYGYAKAPDSVRLAWGKAVDKYLNGVDNLCGLVFLLDCRREPGEEDLMLLEWVEYRKMAYIMVLTKADKLSRGALAAKVKEMGKGFRSARLIPFSSQTRTGKTEIMKWIDEVIEKYRPERIARGSI